MKAIVYAHKVNTIEELQRILSAAVLRKVTSSLPVLFLQPRR